MAIAAGLSMVADQQLYRRLTLFLDRFSRWEEIWAFFRVMYPKNSILG